MISKYKIAIIYKITTPNIQCIHTTFVNIKKKMYIKNHIIHTTIYTQ